MKTNFSRLVNLKSIAVFLFIAIALSITVIATLKQRAEIRSRAQPVAVQNELPVTEFGTIIQLGIGQASSDQALAMPNERSENILGTTESTEAATPDCQYADGQLICPTSGPIACPPGGQIVNRGADQCGCQLPPDCIVPTLTPMVTIFPTSEPPVTITPAPSPPAPIFALKTDDNRTYTLFPRIYPPCTGSNCPLFYPQPIDFRQYVGTIVLIEGILKKDLQQFDSWWPLPNNLRFEVTRILPAERIITNYTTPPDSLVNADHYPGENVYMFSTLEPCSWPLFPCPQPRNVASSPIPSPRRLYVRSSSEDLYSRINTVLGATGDVYAISSTQEYFINAKRVTPPPPPGCSYQKVQCVTQLCEPVLVCPTTTTGPVQPCLGKPEGSACTTSLCPACPTGSTICPKAPCQLIPGTCVNGQCVGGPMPTCIPLPKCVYEGVIGPNGTKVFCDPPPGTNYCPLPSPTPTPGDICSGKTDGTICNAGICIPCPTGVSPCAEACQFIPGSCLNQKCIPLPASPTVTPTPTPAAPINLELRLRFGGVEGGNADGATATIRFVGNNSNLITPPVVFRHTENGIYQAVVTIESSELVPGSGYVIIVKGEKHVGRKFCKNGQTAPCQPNESLTIPATGDTPAVFDFSGLTLDPGDLFPQDGKVDSNDLARLTALMNKPCSSLTDEEKYVGDLDYNGCVTVKDVYLFRKTLETRYDEN